MSDDELPMMKTNQTFLEKMIPQRLEKFITTALTKLKNVWAHESAQTGIQFYGDMDD